MSLVGKKTVVLLLNLGGPNKPEAIRPFLFNLFSDKAIISLPQPFRFLIAYTIAKFRAPKAQKIYGQIGGRSPILENTEKQAKALEQLLGNSFSVLPVMRYWKPRASDVVKHIIDTDVQNIVIMPLYPHYSTTTTESSYLELTTLLKKHKFQGHVSFRCCYPLNPGWIAALQDLIVQAIAKVPSSSSYRLLFTAHGLPEKVIKEGDPYQYQIESTAAKIVQALNIDNLDWRLSYQSRVGPMKWIGPATDEEIIKAGAEKKGLVVVPIAFVSEHSETLVELDRDYKQLAEDHQVPFYVRVLTVSDHEKFIEGLADMVIRALGDTQKVSCPVLGGCNNKFKKCGARFG